MELLFRNASLFKVCFHLKTTATEVFEVQLNFFSYFMKKSCSFLEIFIFLYFNSFIKEGLNHIETSPLICSANQWPGFYVRDLRHDRV